MELLSLLSNKIPELVIFIFIIAGNYVGDVFSCQLRHFFNNSMISKHIISYFILFIFVGFLGVEKPDPLNSLLVSLILYIIFIFLMRSHYIISLLVISIFIIIYILDSIDNQEKNNKNKKYKKIKKLLFIIAGTLALLGFAYKLHKTSLVFGKEWNMYNFLLGSRDQECFQPKFENEFSPLKKNNTPIKILKRLTEKQ